MAGLQNVAVDKTNVDPGASINISATLTTTDADAGKTIAVDVAIDGVASAPVSVTVNEVAPPVPPPLPPLTLADLTATLNGTSDVTLEVHCSTDIANVAFYDGSVKLADVAPTDGTATNTSTLSAGLHTVKAKGWNVSAGQSGGASTATLTASITVAGTPPPPLPPPTTSGAVVSSRPDAAVPNPPNDVWVVAYANGFGGSIPGCTSKLPSGSPTDNSIAPTNGKPSNSNEPTWYVGAQNIVDVDGLHQRVTYQPGVATGKNYAAGELTTKPSGLWQYCPGQGEAWCFEMIAKLPPTTGEADPAFWSSSATWQAEIDFPEFWGWHAGSGGKNWAQSGGDGMGFPAIPRTNGGGSAHGEATFYWNGTTLTFDPSADFHKYSTVMFGTKFYSWLDGKPMCKGMTVGSVGGWSKEMSKLILQHSLRDPTTGNPSPYFKSGYRDFLVRSIAVYQNKGANFSHCSLGKAVIAPGTTLV